MHRTATDEPLSTMPSRELLERYHNARTASLLNEIVRRNLHLVRQVTRRFADRGESMEDLHQVASIGLVKAIQSYNPSLGHQFTTYAVPTMLGEVKRWFRDNTWALRVPRRLQEMGQAVRRVSESLQHTLGRSPTMREIANVLRVTSEQVAEALESTQHYRALSIEALQSPTGDDGEERLPLSIGRVDADMASADLRVTLQRACARLPKREQDIVRMRFVEGLSQAQVARMMSLSQMHISRLQARALTSLRSFMAPVQTAPHHREDDPPAVCAIPPRARG